VRSVPAPPVALWRRADLLVFACAYGVGLLLLAAGYWGVSGTRVFSDQVSSARLAAIGVLVAQAGIVRSVIRGRRALAGRLRACLPDVPAVAGGAAPATNAIATGALVASPDMTRYHAQGCPFVAGKPVAAASAAEHERAGRRACGVCRP
jgi:hypothetical protein